MVDFQIATPSDVLQEILDRLSHHDMGDGQYDGDRAIRLVDASYALHMAIIALNGVDLEQDPFSCGLDDVVVALSPTSATLAGSAVALAEIRAGPAAGDSGGRTGTRPGVSSVEIEHIGNEVDSGVIHPIFKATLAMQSILQRVEDPEIHRCIEGAIEELDDVIRYARRFIFDLNRAFD